MSRTFSIAVLPGDGIGPEIIEQAVRKVLDSQEIGGFGLRTGDLGGSATTKQVGDKVLEVLDTLL